LPSSFPYTTLFRSHEQVLALPVDAIPLRRRAAHARAPGRARTRIGVTGARDDDDLVLGIAAHVAEGLGKLPVRQETPLQGSAAAVKGHLEDALAPLHADGLVLRGVVVEARHQM